MSHALGMIPIPSERNWHFRGNINFLLSLFGRRQSYGNRFDKYNILDTGAIEK